MNDQQQNPQVPYGKRYWYDHMGPQDQAIWERFIAAYPTAYETCQYDVAVGTPPQFDTTVNPATDGNIARLYMRKIDVVGFKPGAIDIIEVKPRAGMSAVGQVVGYRELYVRDHKPALLPKAVIVTDRSDPDLEQVAAAQGVRVVIV